MPFFCAKPWSQHQQGELPVDFCHSDTAGIVFCVGTHCVSACTARLIIIHASPEAAQWNRCHLVLVNDYSHDFNTPEVLKCPWPRHSSDPESDLQTVFPTLFTQWQLIITVNLSALISCRNRNNNNTRQATSRGHLRTTQRWHDVVTTTAPHMGDVVMLTCDTR